MKRGSAIFLQVIIVLIGVGALAFMLWEPHVEGANAHATLLQMYFNSFVVYVFIASIPFFVVLYQAFKLLGYVGRNKVFSAEAVKSLRTMKYCAIAIIGFVVGGEIIILLHDSDDRAGGVFMGILISFGSVVIATAAAMFERVLQNAVDIKSENDLTV
jgi:heme/copper-type cytochrome/quinol oxidase subunit 4